MVRAPKTLPADASLAQAWSALDDDHVHMLLLTDRGRLVGTLLRSDLPGEIEVADEDGLGAQAALPYAVMAGRTVASQRSAEETRRLLVRGSQRRLAVVEPNGGLLGLLCLKRQLTGFCSDADVAARGHDKASREAL